MVFLSDYADFNCKRSQGIIISLSIMCKIINHHSPNSFTVPSLSASVKKYFLAINLY